LYMNGLSGNAEINNIDLRNITGFGIYSTGSPNKVQLSNITGNTTSATIVSINLTQGAIILENSNFVNNNVYLATGASSLVEVSNTNITAVTSGDAITVSGGNNVAISRVNIDGVSNGGGLRMDSLNGNAEINNIDFRNISGFGIDVTGSSSKVQLSNITGNGNDSKYGLMVYISLTQGAIILENSTFVNGGVSLTTYRSSFEDMSCLVEVSNCSITAKKEVYALTISDAGNIAISNVNIDGVSSGGSSGGIAVSGGRNVAISRVNINGIIGSAVLVNSAANVAIDRVNIDGVNGRGMYINGIGRADISNVVIKNCTTSGDGGGIYSGGLYSDRSSTFTINDTTIENVEATDGGGIYYYNGSLTINGCTIKNAKASDEGGGICFNNSTLTINDTTIENVEATDGGGIYTFSGSLTINDCIIKNAKASDEGGGIYFMGSNTLTINGTTMELCRAEISGAIYSNLFYDDVSYSVNNTLTNSLFINCTASGGKPYYFLYQSKILYAGAFAVISNCTFTHDENLPDMGASISGNLEYLFGHDGGNFENCTFNNLRGNLPSGQNYIFNNWRNYPPFAPSGGGSWVDYWGGAYLTLRNCTFNLNSGSAGIIAFSEYSGSINPNYFLMDGVTINNNGGQQPLIWLNGNSTFQFKPNNTYNGTLLNNAGAITGLASSGILYLTNGAMPTLVP
jgi:hypothetical protein